MHALSQSLSHFNTTPTAVRRTVLTVFGLGSAALGAAAEAQIRFDDPRNYPGQFSHLALADFDGDAHLDAAMFSGQDVVIYFNDGAGKMTEGFRTPSGNRRAWNLIAGDVDGDGHVDLVWFGDDSNYPPRIFVFYNRGDGRGGDLHQFTGPVVNRRIDQIALADLTGNGQLDVAITSDRSVWVMEHRARGEGVTRHLAELHTGSFDHDPYSLIAGDFDADGDVDLAVVHGYWGHEAAMTVLFLNRGHLVETAKLEGLSKWPHEHVPKHIRASDLDGDGDLDFVISAAYMSIWGYTLPAHAQVVFHDANRRLREGTLMEFGLGVDPALGLADLDGDGTIDMIATSHNFLTNIVWLHVLRGRGDGTFEPVLDAPVTTKGFFEPTQLALGDLHRGGRFDVSIATHGGLTILRNLSPITGPDLAHSRLVRGRPAGFRVQDAEPGERVDFVYSLSGAGHSPGRSALGGMVLDLNDPIVHFGSATADANGTAVLRRLVPSTWPLTTVVGQAVIRRGPGGEDSVKTPFRTARIEE